MMKRCLMLAWLLVAAPAFAQSTIDTGAITAVSSGGTCAVVAGCSNFTLANANVASVTLQVTGTFTGTLLFEATSDNLYNTSPNSTSVVWVTITGVKLLDGSSSTGFASVGGTNTGQFAFRNSGLLGIRVRATAWTSGAAVTTAVRGYASALSLSPFATSFLAGTSGGCTAPGFSFQGDTDTGIGYLGANNAAGCAGGATSFDWTAARVLFAVPATVSLPNIITTSTDGFVCQNLTAATAGVPVQQSCRLRFRSNVWNTTATAATNTDDWWIESVPVSGTTPSGLLKFGKSLNGGATTFPLTVTSAGVLTTLSSIVTGGAVFVPDSVGFYFSTFGRLKAVANGNFNLLVSNESTGVGLDVATDAILKIRTRAHTGYGTVEGLFRTAGPVTAVSNTSANSCGTTAAVIGTGSNDNNGSFTVGATSGTSCTLTFTLAATNRRDCTANNETTANLARVVYVNTTTSKVEGTFIGVDVVSYVCFAR